MPKNGFFFLFMATVTPKANNGKDPGPGQRRNTTELFKFRCRKQLPPASPVPRKQNAPYDAAPPTMDSPGGSSWNKTSGSFQRLQAATKGRRHRVHAREHLLPAPAGERCLAELSLLDLRTEQGRPCLQPVLDAFLRPSYTSRNPWVLFFPKPHTLPFRIALALGQGLMHLNGLQT